jgi:tetratricopeptide (TPR) repeat protein
LFHECGDLHGMAECLYYLGDWESDLALQKGIFVEMLSIDQATGDMLGTGNALFALGSCATIAGDYEDAFANFNASRELHRKVGCPESVAFLGMVLGTVSQFMGNLERASQFMEEALSAYREIVNDRHGASCHFSIGQIAFAQGRYEEVAARSEKALSFAKKTGNPEILAEVLYLRARLARLNGKAEEARQLAEEGFHTAPNFGDIKWLLLLELGHLALQAGDLAQAGALWRQGLGILLRVNKTPFLCYWVDVLAVLAARQDRQETAARLFGTRQWRGAAHMLSPIEYSERQADLSKIKSALGEERFTRLQEEGQALTFNQVLALTQTEG